MVHWRCISSPYIHTTSSSPSLVLSSYRVKPKNISRYIRTCTASLSYILSYYGVVSSTHLLTSERGKKETPRTGDACIHLTPTTDPSLQVLIQILSSFPTRKLLPLALVSRHFAGVVGRLHYFRLHEASLLQDHEMILECYHPSVKISTPTLFCEYLGTDGLEGAGQGVKFGEMNQLYTRFRPYLGDEHLRPRARYPTRRMAEGADDRPAELPTHDLHLDTGELFSQLCTVASLIKIGPKRGLFLSIANVTDGWVRVFRSWLDAQVAKSADSQQRTERTETDNDSILWTSSAKDVGLKLRVVAKDNPHVPVFVEADEEPRASYELQYEGRKRPSAQLPSGNNFLVTFTDLFVELLIRTNQLVLSLEASLAQQVHPSSKAVMMVPL